MNADPSYLTERLAERRRRVVSGVAGIALLMVLGFGLLLPHPMPGAYTTSATSSNQQVAGSSGEPGALTALR